MPYDYATALSQLHRKAKHLEALREATSAGQAAAAAPSTWQFVIQNRGSLGALLLLYLGATTGIVYSAYASQQLQEDEAQYLVTKQLVIAQKTRLQEQKAALLQRLRAVEAECGASRHLWLESALRARLTAALAPAQPQSPGRQPTAGVDGGTSAPAAEVRQRVII